MIQGDGATLALGQRRALEGRPKDKEGPKSREKAKIEEGNTGKRQTREAERERKPNQKKRKMKERSWRRKKSEEGD